MACGVHLGILLICLVQAEHVRCLWATQARGQNSNTYVGFSQQRGGPGGSYPQNELRQASGSPGSAQSSSFNTDPDVSSGYSQRFPSSRYTQAVSRPAKSGFASVKLAQSSSESKPNWRTTTLNQEHVQKMPKKKPFAFSGSIAGGSSLSKYHQTPVSKKRTGPGQQGSPGTSHSRTSSTGTSGQGFAPSRNHNIPQRFGGFAIRRLKEPADQKEVSVRKPQQAYVAPQRPLVPLHQAYVAPQKPLALQHQAYVAPQKPLALQHQDYVAPQRSSASHKPQVLSVRPEASWKRIRSRVDSSR
ncbi:uncharacterized protein LOC117750480 [Cyclopterus lumpus]|uniref:uncharacterized protein LOC117750480 n=1 Tax=Cyclopterus lumpus TaxID=8103 RepID=UPI001486EB22|nr:uncharacterized protein LOC117750480 [Cyclopterus lumpus]